MIGRETEVHLAVDTDDPARLIERIDQELRPRWAMWSGDTALALVRVGVRVATSWDIAAVHRLLVGGWTADPARVWAWARDLPASSIPPVPIRPAPPFGPDDGARTDQFQPALFEVDVRPGPRPDRRGGAPADDATHGRGEEDQGEEDQVGEDGAIGPDGHLRPAWVAGDWSASVPHLERWAQLAAVVVERQLATFAALDDGLRDRAEATARSESAAELLCAEMTVDGLPMDRPVAEQVIAGFVGRRPESPADAEELARARQSEVLQHAPGATCSTCAAGSTCAARLR